MDLYRVTFAGTILLNAFTLLQSHRSRKTESSKLSGPDDVRQKGLRTDADRESLSKLKWRFFPIYLLVNAADWLQGPYIYPIYKGLLLLFVAEQ